MPLEPTISHPGARSTSEEHCDERVVSRVIGLRKTWEQVAKLSRQFRGVVLISNRSTQACVIMG